MSVYRIQYVKKVLNKF